MRLDKRVAWNATQNLFITVGAAGTVAFAATLQWWLCLVGTAVLALAWTLLYRIELSARRMYGEAQKRGDTADIMDAKSLL